MEGKVHITLATSLVASELSQLTKGRLPIHIAPINSTRLFHTTKYRGAHVVYEFMSYVLGYDVNWSFDPRPKPLARCDDILIS